MSQAERILGAVAAVVAERGLPAVSVRVVAERAGVSPAQVQYYFRTKDRLLVAAFEFVHEQMRRRVAAVDTSGTVVEVLRRYLLTWFPLDAERRAHATVWLAFTATATTTPQFEPTVREADAAIVEGLRGLIEHGQATGALRPDLDPSSTASLLLAVVDGLSMRALTHRDPGQLAALLDEHLAALAVERPDADPDGNVLNLVQHRD